MSLSLSRLAGVALTACRVCGLTRSERQLWRGALLGPVVNLIKVNVGGGIVAIPLTFRLCGQCERGHAFLRLSTAQFLPRDDDGENRPR